MACEPSPSCGGRPASAGLLLRVDRPRGCRRPLPGRNARALGRWAACRDRAVPSTPFGAPAPSTPSDAPASRPPEPFPGWRATNSYRELDSTPPDPPLSSRENLAAIPPDAAKPAPSAPPAGFLVFGPLPPRYSAVCHREFRGGGIGGSAAKSAEPFAVRLPLGSPCGSALRAPPSSRSPLSSQAGAQIHGLR